MTELEQILKDLEQGRISADHAEAVILRLFSVVGRSEQLPPKCVDGFDDPKFCDRSGECEWCSDIRR